MTPAPLPEPTDRAFIERAVRIGIIAALVLGALFGALWVLKGALTPLVAAWVIAYLFDPLIDRFEARGLPRSAAIGILLLAGGAVFLGLALVVVPSVQRDLAALTETLPGTLRERIGAFGPRIEALFGVPLPATLQDALETLRAGEFEIPLEAVRGVFERLVAGVTGTVGALVSLVLIPVLAYYLLVEFDRIRLAVLGLVPEAYQDNVAQEAARVDALVSGFIRGQLTVCMALGVLYALGYAIIGVDLALVIGLVGGLLAIIPYVGGAFALVAAATMTLLEFGFGVQLALVVGWYALVQGLEGFVLTPRIVGGSLGMHPVTVIVALLIGGDLLGFLGLLVAVPIAAVVQVFLQDALAAYRRSALYQAEGDPPESPPTRQGDAPESPPTREGDAPESLR